jgi:zinc protease
MRRGARRLAALALVAPLLVACLAGVTRRWRYVPFPDTPETHNVRLPARDVVLDNGLQIIVLPDSNADLVQIDVRYLAGAKEDPADKRGLAHLVEHLSYELRAGDAGSPRLGARAAAATVYSNAWTSWDATHYVNRARVDDVGEVLAVEAARMSAPCDSLDDEIVAREREVVRNELRERGVEGSLVTLLLARLYPPEHPYAHSVAGSDAEVAALGTADVCAFLRDHYTPDAAIVVIAGRIDAEKALGLAQAAFAGVPKRPRPPVAALPDAPWKPGKERLEADVDQPLLLWVWSAPPAHSAEGVAISLVAGELAVQVAGALRKEPAVIDVGATTLGGDLAPRVVVAVLADADADLAAVVEKVEAQLRVTAEGPEWVTGPMAWRRANRSTLFALESLAARTETIADVAQWGPGASPLRHISGRDQAVVEVARTFTPERARLITVVPRHAAAVDRASARPPTLSGTVEEDPADVDVDLAEARARYRLPERRAALPPARRFTLENGLRVILQPTPSSLPITRARLVIRAGTAHEPRDHAGVASLAAFSTQYLSIRALAQDTWTRAPLVAPAASASSPTISTSRATSGPTSPSSRPAR